MTIHAEEIAPRTWLILQGARGDMFVSLCFSADGTKANQQKE
jgi:hypothetical protein